MGKKILDKPTYQELVDALSEMCLTYLADETGEMLSCKSEAAEESLYLLERLDKVEEVDSYVYKFTHTSGYLDIDNEIGEAGYY